VGRPRFVAVGDVMIDISASGVGHAARIELGIGGTAVNAGIWAAACGAESSVVGRVGDDFAGRALRDAVEGRGVRADLSVDPEAPTGTFLVVDGHIRADRGANARFGPEHLPGRLGAEAVLVSGYLPAETVAAAIGHAEGDWIALAPASLDPLPYSARAVLVDEDEARRLTGAEPEEAARILGRSFELACVTRGAAGAVAVHEGRVETSAPAPGEGASSVGAGDAFAAGLLVALARGADLRDALESACRAGATIATGVAP
jgi:sugar/nucleoside kinase (ribokinase family)